MSRAEPPLEITRAWGRFLRVTAVKTGVNNDTWRLGDDLWLTRVPIEDVDRLERERSLLDALAAVNARFAIPSVVPTSAGRPHYVTSEHAWRVTRTVRGTAPSATDPQAYVAVATGLAEVHAVLATLTPDLQVARRTLRDDLALAIEGEWHDLGPAAALVDKAVRILRAGGAAIFDVPCQLIHGDFSFPNLTLSDDSTYRLTGVLDFEFCSFDPPILDLATLGSTVICRSGSADVAAVIERACDAYCDAAQLDISLSDLTTAIVARRLASFRYHRERSLADRSAGGVANRQIDFLRRTLQVVSRGIV